MKTSIFKLSLLLLFLFVILNVIYSTGAARAASATMTSLTNLQADASRWGIFQDHGSAVGSVANVTSPTIDGSTLAVSLIDGQPYTGIHAYRNLAANDKVVSIELDLSFRISNTTPLQALEFTTSKWENNQRWEWALQWERISDGGPQHGVVPTWRLWTGSSWMNIGVTQKLRAGSWHILRLTGDILDGNVHYTGFQCDGITTSLTQTFAPVFSPGNLLAVGVQLDGNKNESAYQVYIDDMTLSVQTDL